MYTALVIYEYLVTFTTEVQLFWVRELTGASILFFINRYVAILVAIIALISKSKLYRIISYLINFSSLLS